MFSFRTILSLTTLISLSFTLVTNLTGRTAAPADSPIYASFEKAGNYGRSTLTFEENKGQTDREAKFISRARGFNVYLAETEVVFQLKREMNDKNETAAPKTAPKISSDYLRMSFVGANATPTITGEDETVTKTNFYHDRTRLENISNFGRAKYERLYDGIDAVFYGNASNQLEYDFNIAPNADPSQIKLEFDGAQSVEIDETGKLVIKTANTELVQRKPFAYQMINGEKHEVEASYVFAEQSQIANRKSQIHFSLGEYDRSLPLVIDPVLDYLTYIGGSALDDAFEIAADAQGSAYFTGVTESLNFHGETRDERDNQGAYIAKLNAAGTAFLYITILEGNGPDFARGITVDESGNAYVAGAASRFFPTTSGAFDTTHGTLDSGDAFVAKLNASGGLIYSSYIGGAGLDEAFDVAIDSTGKAYVVGSTYSNTAFPTKNKYQGCGVFNFPTSVDSEDAFLTVMNASGSDITYSTCIGNTGGTVGAAEDSAFSVVVDSSNNAYVTGVTNSNSFKVKNPFQPNLAGGESDAWLAKFNPAASGDASVIFASYLGGTGTDRGFGVAVNLAGQAVVVGVTGSANFPLLNAFDTTNQINEGFVSVVNSTGSALVNSSFLGGSDRDSIFNVALDQSGSIYVTGETVSNDFPLALPFQSSRAGFRDAFVTKLKFGRGIISSSYLGGNGNDQGDGIAVRGKFIYVAGDSKSTNLSTTDGVVKQSTDNDDAFVAKILDTQLDSVGIFRSPTTFSLTQSIANVVPVTPNFTSLIAGQRGVSGDWDGDGVDSIGSFTNGSWKVRNVNFPIANIPAIFGGKTMTFGQTGDLPVTGDWNNDGVDTPGVFRPSTGQFLLTNSTSSTPAVDVTVNFGLNGDLPVAGDWNADGIDSVGVFRPSSGQFFLTDDNVLKASIDQTFFFGTNGDLPVGGDWNGDGVVTIGVYRPSTTEFFLTNDNINFSNVFTFGNIGDQPIVGDWNGIPNP